MHGICHPLTSNNQFMPGCIAGESADREVGASCRLRLMLRDPRSQSQAKTVRVCAMGTDSAIWHCRGDDGSWSDWQSLGGRLLAAPAAKACLAEHCSGAEHPRPRHDHTAFELLDL
jgi:hypothetical protein